MEYFTKWWKRLDDVPHLRSGRSFVDKEIDVMYMLSLSAIKYCFYKLTPNEIALVLGTAIHYDVAEVVDPLVHVVARIDKKALARLGPN